MLKYSLPTTAKDGRELSPDGRRSYTVQPTTAGNICRILRYTAALYFARVRAISSEWARVDAQISAALDSDAPQVPDEARGNLLRKRDQLRALLAEAEAEERAAAKEYGGGVALLSAEFRALALMIADGETPEAARQKVAVWIAEEKRALFIAGAKVAEYRRALDSLAHDVTQLNHVRRDLRKLFAEYRALASNLSYNPNAKITAFDLTEAEAGRITQNAAEVLYFYLIMSRKRRGRGTPTLAEATRRSGGDLRGYILRALWGDDVELSDAIEDAAEDATKDAELFEAAKRSESLINAIRSRWI